MTNERKKGYDDQMGNRLDEALFSDETQRGLDYREGRRAARRELEDAQSRLEEIENAKPSPERPDVLDFAEREANEFAKEARNLETFPKKVDVSSVEYVKNSPAPGSLTDAAERSGLDGNGVRGPETPAGDWAPEGIDAVEDELEETRAAPAGETDGGDQFALFDVKPGWTDLWRGMPEFDQKDLSPWQTIPIHVACRADRERLSKLLGQTITDDTRSLWFPKAEIGRFVDKRWVTPKKKVWPRYPIYVISKGRWESRLTVKALEEIGLPFHVVVEPQELENYAAVIDRSKILALPFSNLGQGSIPARNWVWNHARATGAARHWILDDNIDGFFRLHNNLKVPVKTGATFAAAEDFVDRYANVAIAGFQYFMFASRKTVVPPLTINTRIYSCILLRNDLPYEWRGRYNEDTDLSLRALKDGHCTVLFNAFLAYKMTTMTMTGGNTEALYKIKEGEKDGRLLMAESLKAQHPDLVDVIWKWGRWQHSVNYRVFRQKLVPRPDARIPEEPDNYGMELEHLPDR